jgi:hypothetical protein
MNESVQYLDDLANHFAHRDWDYTRNHNIKHIRYKDEERDTLKYRVGRSLRWMFKKTSYIPSSFKWKLILAFYALKKQDHLPDGHLDGGNVITHWEETGEYLQMVQPSVGALLVNFLKEDPDHKHAKLIIAELDRISNRYSERIKKGETDE